jgi:hypothetical protein
MAFDAMVSLTLNIRITASSRVPIIRERLPLSFLKLAIVPGLKDFALRHAKAK